MLPSLMLYFCYHRQKKLIFLALVSSIIQSTTNTKSSTVGTMSSDYENKSILVANETVISDQTTTRISTMVSWQINNSTGFLPPVDQNYTETLSNDTNVSITDHRRTTDAVGLN